MTKGKKASKPKHGTKPRKICFKYKFIKKSLKGNKLNSKQNLHQKPTKIKEKAKKKTKCNNLSIVNKESLNVNNVNIEQEYMLKELDNYYETYSDNYLIKILEDLSRSKNKITPEILHKYDLTEELRSLVFNYFYDFIETYKLSFKYYFYSISIYDNFLINFSKDESNKDKCKEFFKSKETNQLSYTKLVVYIFCCFYIYYKFYKTDSITIDNLLQIQNAKNEVTFDDLLNLSINIINYNLDYIDSTNIYTFIDIYMFKIRKICNLNDDEKYFITELEKRIYYLAAKIGKNLEFSKIDESLAAFACILYSFNLYKNILKVNSSIETYISGLLNKFQLLLIKYYDINEISIIINWFNNNWCI